MELLKYLNKNDLKIFKEEFHDFLPEEIFDFHIHLWEENLYDLKIPESRKKENPILTANINNFKYIDLNGFYSKLFPGKKYKGLFFGLPIKEINLQRNNKYISDVLINNNCPGLFIPEPDLKEIPDDFFKRGYYPYLKIDSTRGNPNESQRKNIDSARE